MENVQTAQVENKTQKLLPRLQRQNGALSKLGDKTGYIYSSIKAGTILCKSTICHDEVMAMDLPMAECRACLRKMDEEACQSLFQEWCTSWAVPGALIADFLSKFADIEISEYDRHSKVICPACYSSLADACAFMKSIQRCDTILRKRADNIPSPSPSLSDMETETSSMHHDKNVIESIGNIRSSVEIKQEVLSEEESDLKHMEQGFEPTMEIKIEPEEIVAPVPSNIKVNGSYSLRGRSIANHQNDGNSRIHYEEVEYLANSNKQKAPSEEGPETAADLPLECMLCMKVLRSIKSLKAHVISKHSYSTVQRSEGTETSPADNGNKEYVCATCYLNFKTRADLKVHEWRHGKHVCFICKERFRKLRLMLRHRARCRNTHNQNRTKTAQQELQTNRDPLIEEKGKAMEEQTENVSPAVQVKVEPELEPSTNQIQEENTEDTLNSTDPTKSTCSSSPENNILHESSHSDTPMLEIREDSSRGCLGDSSNSQDNSQKTSVDISCTQSREETNFAFAREPYHSTAREELNDATAYEPHLAIVQQAQLANAKEKLNHETVQEESNTTTSAEVLNGATAGEATELDDATENAEHNVVTVQEESNVKTELDVKSEICLEPELHNSIANEIDEPENSISNIDELNQNMKVHLAINPLKEDNSVNLENKMNTDKSDKSAVHFKLRLVNINELTERNVMQ